jgi:hypothetical protein
LADKLHEEGLRTMPPREPKKKAGNALLVIILRNRKRRGKFQEKEKIQETKEGNACALLGIKSCRNRKMKRMSLEKRLKLKRYYR